MSVAVERAARVRSKLSAVGTMAAVAALIGVFAIPAYGIDSASADASAASDAAPAVAAQDFDVTVSVVAAAQGRDSYSGTSYQEYLEQQAALVRLSYGLPEPVEGDDYPFRAGSGLSELRYYTGQCTDFVAWRLNRDAGVTSAPWLYTWSVMTPWGGDADDWLGAWYQHGWPVSTTPVAGSVAWFGNNHVGYVKEVYADGSFLVEDYNRVAYESYGRTVFSAGSIPYFLYPPGL